MKIFVVLSVLLYAVSAAPAEAEEKAPEAPVEALKEQPDAAPEMKNEVMAENVEADAPENAMSVPRSARFNFCPTGWYSQGSRCFKFVSSPMTWYNAEEHCNSLGGNLASVTSPREYTFLQQITQTAGQSIAWLGGFNLQGRWMWIDRQGLYYTNWYSPSSSSSYPCMYLRSTNGWGNTACTSSYRFICSKDPFSC